MCHSLTDTNFQSEVLDQPSPTVVVFFADWSGPCQMLAPVLEQIEATYQGQVRFWKMDVEHNDLTVARYGVRRLPTMCYSDVAAWWTPSSDWSVVRLLSPHS